MISIDRKEFQCFHLFMPVNAVSGGPDLSIDKKRDVFNGENSMPVRAVSCFKLLQIRRQSRVENFFKKKFSAKTLIPIGFHLV
jgi:hypothetical protein